jgi:hypothetical protein
MIEDRGVEAPDGQQEEGKEKGEEDRHDEGKLDEGLCAATHD